MNGTQAEEQGLTAPKRFYSIRHAIGSDLNFIYDSWLTSFRYDSAFGKSHKNSVFFPQYRRVLDEILSKPDTQTLVAHDPDNLDVVLGYLVYEPGILHYVFTKEAFRKYGIAAALLQYAAQGRELLISHKTLSVINYLRAHPEFTHDQTILMKKMEVPTTIQEGTK